MLCVGRNAGICPGGRECARRVARIVRGVDEIVCAAWMIRLRREDTLRETNRLFGAGLLLRWRSALVHEERDREQGAALEVPGVGGRHRTQPGDVAAHARR